MRLPIDPVRAFTSLPGATRAANWLVNPHGRPSERDLRDAVAGSVILVTGASHGIGEATARKLGAAGANVLLVARSEDKLEEMAAEIARRGGTAHAHPADLSDPDSVDSLVAAITERHGHVDVLVNNAGKSIRRSIELSYDRFQDFERTIDINYLGPVRLLLGLLPAMRERRQGHIVNVSTIGVIVPPAPFWAAYTASKTAYDVFLRTVAMEAEPDGVTATSIYMGLVRTRMSAPTPGFRNVPGLWPEEAADVVCHAIVDRPRVIAPWWAEAAEVGAAVARRPFELAFGWHYRSSRDTKSSASAVVDGDAEL
jgi:NAD(P)-dependent dehydrogenase (short-subunit alcohol dehydrogenase family)